MTESRKDLLKQLRDLKASQIAIMKDQAAYRDKNKIEFFDTLPSPGPNPKQAQILEALFDPTYKIFGASGGNRMGKTCLLTLVGLSVMFGKFPWNNKSLLQLFPHNLPRKVRYIGQGWNDHVKAVVIPELDKWWPQNRKLKKHGNGIISDTFWQDVRTGSTLEIMSNNQRSKEHEGWSGDLILYDEPCRREIYIANARGLVDRQGREMFAATLLEEPWIHQEIVKKVDEKGRADRSIFWIEGTSYDNVGYGIKEEGVEQLRAKLTEDEIKIRIMGIPQYMSGLVYPDFDRNIHLRERFQVPFDWPVDIGIDIHPRERQAVLFVATDPRGERYVCEEVWEYGDGTWVGEEIVRIVNRNSYRVNQIVIDPLSKGDSNNPETTYDKVFNVLAAHDMVLEVATKDKTPGILEVKKHLMGPNKKPSLYIFDDLVRTLFEIEGYMWEMKQGKPTGKPMDKDDHMMENLYRLLLLNTQYIGMNDSLYDDYRVDHKKEDSRGSNKTTGY